MKRDSFPAPGSSLPVVDLAQTFPKTPALVTFYTRCGKPSCRCRQGALHGPYWQMRWREGSTQRRRYVRPADLAGVQAALELRRAHRQRVRRQLASSAQLLRRLRYGAAGASYGLWAAMAGDDMIDEGLDEMIEQLLKRDRETIASVLAGLEPEQAAIDALLERDREQLAALLREIEQEQP